MDAVERREFAAKKAQLAAAELSKLSKRICGKLFALRFQASVVYLVSAKSMPFLLIIHEDVISSENFET